MKVVRLSRKYRCRLGAPVITHVNREIFVLRYFTHCMQCGWCGDACCQDGVDIDAENVARIMTFAEALERRVGRRRHEWFSDEYDTDPEFPGGRATRTRVVDGGCVFLDRRERGCLLHRFALEAGMDYHDLKPLVSTLFPITFEDGTLVAADEVASGTLVCAGDGPTLYQALRAELGYYFGERLVGELDALSVALAPQAPPPVR